MRIVFLGSAGILSTRPLEAMVAAHRTPVAVVTPWPGRERTSWHGLAQLDPEPGPATLPLVERAFAPTAAAVALGHGIPAFAASRLSSVEGIEMLRELRPDVFVSSCYPEILDEAVCRVPTLGCFNVHPSPLPEFRGPSPLFWIFREGRGVGGTTVHQMERRADAGPITAQQVFPLPDGISGAELALRCSSLGAELLLEVLDQLEAGRLEQRPQEEARSSTFGFPRPEDWSIGTDRPARWAFNFIRGVGRVGRPVRIRLPSGRLVEASFAAAYAEHETRSEELCREDGAWVLKFRPGILVLGPDDTNGPLSEKPR
jgi:methionyl-tRNA formyltransferase